MLHRFETYRRSRSGATGGVFYFAPRIRCNALQPSAAWRHKEFVLRDRPANWYGLFSRDKKNEEMFILAMKKSITTNLFLISLVNLLGASSAAASQQDLRSADWSVNASHNLADYPPSSDQVWKFMNDVWIQTSGSRLCSFRFVDLRRLGELSLVAVIGGNNTGPDCTEVAVIDKDANQFELYVLAAAGNSDLARIIKNLNGDGHFELVVDDPLLYEGTKYPGTCMVLWPRVYAWTGSGYTEVSSQYPKYYEGELRSINQKIATIKSAEAATPAVSSSAPISGVAGPMSESMTGHWKSTSEDPQVANVNPLPEATPGPAANSASSENASMPYTGDLDCLKVEAAKMERFLNASKDAGMADAIRWANSDNPDQREFAVWIFGELRTPEALQYEQTLSGDSDRDVADFAKTKIKDWDKPKPPASFERLSVTR
jgi:hypothetical protein